MVKERSEIDDKYKWDLQSMYQSSEECLEELNDVKSELDQLKEFKGEVTRSDTSLLKVLRLNEEVSRKLEDIRKYARMKRDVDTRDQDAQELLSKVDTVKTNFESQSSFIKPEIVEAGKERVDELVGKNKSLEKYRHFLDDLFRLEKHILAPEKEQLISNLGDVSDTAYESYSALTNADIEFPEVEKPSGETVELTLGNYGKFQKNQDRVFRKETYDNMYDTFDQYKNTISTTLSKNIKKNVRYAEIKNYDSAREASLKPNNIPLEIYDNLTETVNNNLNLLQRFMDLKRKALGLDELKAYDMYMPVAQTESPEVPYKDAREYILEALQPLGDDYVRKVKKGLDEESWADLYENKGKRSGAYSGGSYDSKPFILMNYQDDIDSMFTLIHEIGHSMHSYYSTEEQPYIYSDYTIFQAEVASTTNEALLIRHLLNNVEQDKFRKHVLSHALENFRGTLFRQTMFSEFEEWLHREVEEGEALSHLKLDEKYGELKDRYYSNVELDDRIRKEWMKIPHFYYNFYVYQYATGISAGTVLADKIVNNGPGNYKNFLKKGGSEYSIESLKEAGVKIDTSEPIDKAMSKFEGYLEELNTVG